MGKGDMRTRRGKISRGSFGKSRLKKKVTTVKKTTKTPAKKK